MSGHPLEVALGLLRADAPEQITHAPEAWPRWVVLLPHVLAVTNRLDCPNWQPGPAMMTDASWLLDRAGTHLQVHAQLPDARPLLERALAITEAVCGPSHPNVGPA